MTDTHSAVNPSPQRFFFKCWICFARLSCWTFHNGRSVYWPVALQSHFSFTNQGFDLCSFSQMFCRHGARVLADERPLMASLNRCRCQYCHNEHISQRICQPRSNKEVSAGAVQGRWLEKCLQSRCHSWKWTGSNFCLPFLSLCLRCCYN